MRFNLKYTGFSLHYILDDQIQNISVAKSILPKSIRETTQDSPQVKNKLRVYIPSCSPTISITNAITTISLPKVLFFLGFTTLVCLKTLRELHE